MVAGALLAKHVLDGAGVDLTKSSGQVQIDVPHVGQPHQNHLGLLGLEPQEIGILRCIKRIDPASVGVPRELCQGMNGVDAHHLVVHILLETIQTPERARLGATSGKPTEFHHGSVEPPFHGLGFHFNAMVAVHKRLHAHSLNLARGTKQALLVQVPNRNVFVRQAVLTQPHHQRRVHGVQPIFRKQHFLRAADHQHAVGLVERDFGRQAIRPHPAHLRPTHRQATLVRHAMEHAVQHNPPGAGLEPWVGALFGLLFCLNLEVECSMQGGAKHVALKRGGVRRERAPFQADAERAHFRLKIALAHCAFPIQTTGLHTEFVFKDVVLPTDLMQPGTVSLGQTHHSA